jgi:hypothetical protein
MKDICRSQKPIILLFAALVALLCFSCGPLVWNADVQTFVNNGLTIVSMLNFTARGDATVVPSGEETIVTIELLNPRSVLISGTVSWEDDSLFDSSPALSVVGPTELSLSVTPSLLAERKNLDLTIVLTAPELNRTYDPETITIRCNTPPGSVGDSLDAALDQNGYAFAAFRLPSGATDDDLSRVEIAYARADGTGSGQTVTLSVDDPSLLQEKRTPTGTDILGADDPLDRYYGPAGISSGDDYIFTVVLIDTEGLRSESTSITSSAATYAVTYHGNGNTGGSPPVDTQTYRQTKSVTVLGPGSLVCAGRFFTGWNTLADGKGTSYAPGSTLVMGSSNVDLYAQWGDLAQVQVTFSTPSYRTVVFTYLGIQVTSLSVISSGTPLVLSYADSPSTVGGWAWYMNGVLQVGTAGTYSLDISASGRNIVSCTAMSGGVQYAGSIVVTSTDALRVCYDGNGASTGSPPTDGGMYQNGDPVTVLYHGGLSRPPYQFTGWNTALDGSGTPYAEGATFNIGAASITLYAVWAPDVTPPAPVTYLAFIQTDPVRLTWTDPADGDLMGIRFEYSGLTPGSVIVGKGIGDYAFTVSAPATFIAWAFDESGNYSTESIISVPAP